uniref:ADAM 17-like protease n=1 Tax=Schistocephalus solidus TaxID=70667 RepID=A0A0V0J4A3_SCHSO
MEIVLLVFVNILFNSFCIASAKKFNDILNHYEIINNPHLSENYSNLRFLSVQLKIFGRSLKIHLFLYLANFDKNALQIHLPDKDQFDTTKISLPDFFKGHVIGITPSSAYAHINSKREFSATLVLPDSVIIIEPLSVYQQDNSDKRLIVYRLNDIRNFNLYVLLYLPLLVYASSRAHDVFPAPPTTRRANYVVGVFSFLRDLSLHFLLTK